MKKYIKNPFIILPAIFLALVLTVLQFTPPEIIYKVFVRPAQASNITDLEGITGKIGIEDIYFGTGQDTDTFSVPTYDGGTVTITKLPSLFANAVSIIKGKWYVAAMSGDHGNTALTGSLAWVIDTLSTDPATIELPGNQTYELTTNLSIPETIVLHFQRGAVLGGTANISGDGLRHIQAGAWQIFSTTGTITFPDGSDLKSSWFADFEIAITKISTAKVCLEVTEAYSFSSAIAINANTSLRWTSAGNILGGTANISGDGLKHIQAGAWQIFSTSGTITFPDGSDLKSSWFADFETAITKISTAKVCLEVTEADSIQNDAIVNVNTGLKWHGPGNILTISSTKTLTVNGLINSGDYQIYSGDGLVIVSQDVKPEWFGAVGDAITDSSAAIMKAFNAVYSSGGGKVIGNTAATYIVQGLWPLENVIFDLNGAVLKLKASATHGIIDHNDTTYSPDPSARQHFTKYIPSDPGYTGGFYDISDSTVEAGAMTVTTTTAADAANFSEGDLAILIGGKSSASNWVAESIEVLSGNGGSGIVTFKWPVQKYYRASVSDYFGIAKRDSGYSSGRGFILKNGTLDANNNPGRYVIDFEGMMMDFEDLKFTGIANTYYNVRGTQCRLDKARMKCKKAAAALTYPFSVDMGATGNIVSNSFFNTMTPAINHLGEHHAGTKFLYNTFSFAPQDSALAAQGNNGMIGSVFIGNTFYNYPGNIISINSFDGTPRTQTWIGNEFYGQFTGAVFYSATPSETESPSYGHVTFIGNTLIGEFDSSLAVNANIFRTIRNATIEGNHFYIVDSVSSAINKTDYSSIDYDSVTIRGNVGLPDIVHSLVQADDMVDLTGTAARTTVNGFPNIDMDDATTSGGVLIIPNSNLGGEVTIYGKFTLFNVGAGSGDVKIRAKTGVAEMGTALPSAVETSYKTSTAAGQNIPFTTDYFMLAQNYPSGFGAEQMKIVLERLGADAADTLGNSIGLLSAEILILPYYGYQK